MGISVPTSTGYKHELLNAVPCPGVPEILTINDEHGGIGDAPAGNILRTAAVVGHVLQRHLAEGERAGRNADLVSLKQWQFKILVGLKKKFVPSK